MNWKKECFKNFKLYGITDVKGDGGTILNQIAKAFEGGVDIVQLRSKTLMDASLIRLGLKVRKIANQYRKLFIVNDRVDLALAVEADGVHLGQDDMPLALARRLVRAPMIFGKSTHSLRQAIQAKREGADYIGFGPIFSTPTKLNYAPIGSGEIEAVHKQMSLPIVCIGGINQSNIEQILAAGAKRVAVVRAIFSAPQPKQAAHLLKKIIEQSNF